MQRQVLASSLQTQSGRCPFFVILSGRLGDEHLNETRWAALTLSHTARCASHSLQAAFVATPGRVSVCVCAGTLGGLAIGLVTEYYTSHSYSPVREVGVKHTILGRPRGVLRELHTPLEYAQFMHEKLFCYFVISKCLTLKG